MKQNIQSSLVPVVRSVTIVLTIVALLFSSLRFSFGVPIAAHANTASCNTVTLASSPATQTAGYTETQPTSDANALLPGVYSLGQFVDASTTQVATPQWIDATLDTHFATSSAVWISTNPSWPGGSGNSEGSPQNSQWRLFQDSFVLPVGSTVTDATLWYAADNAVAVYLNGVATPIATTNATTSDDVYSLAPNLNANNFSSAFTATFSPVGGKNVLNFVVRNWSLSSSSPNPTGLLYAAVIRYCLPGPTGTIAGTVVGGTSGQDKLAIDSITATQTTATADGTFANGWKYVFHITDPDNEPHLTLKFGDWFNAIASSTIPAGGNIQISSAQASSTSPIVITAANQYATPSLLLVSDLNPTAPGRQVDVVVEVKVPTGSINGSYSTAYGVQTLP